VFFFLCNVPVSLTERNVAVVLINTFDILQMLTMITTVDDLNYPEKTETYYIVNAPYVFSACWKVSGICLNS
jgi:hypothetical protein